MRKTIRLSAALSAALAWGGAMAMPLGLRTGLWAERAEWMPEISVGADNEKEEIISVLSTFADYISLSAHITNAAEYAEFREWAHGVKDTDGGDDAAGEDAVLESPFAWVAYALGAVRLLANEPSINIISVEAGNASEVGGASLVLSVSVKDGTDAVEVAAAKIAALFEATSDMGNWHGATKLAPKVEIDGEEGGDGIVRFRITPGGGDRAFLRIKVD